MAGVAVGALAAWMVRAVPPHRVGAWLGRRCASAVATSVNGPVLCEYNTLVKSKVILDDDAQRRAAAKLDGVLTQQSHQRGCYLHGSVGGGKTMLMDMFYRNLELPEVAWVSGADADVEKQRGKFRTHFHSFMSDVHIRLHEFHLSRPRRIAITPEGLRIHRHGGPAHGPSTMEPLESREHEQEEEVKVAEEEEEIYKHPVDAAAEVLASQVVVLCLDEVQVHDVADALILNRLFDTLWKHDVKTIFTSNVAPGALYEKGLSYRYFLPFVANLHETCEIVEVATSAGGLCNDDANLDYRRTEEAAGRLDGVISTYASAYYYGTNASERLNAAWNEATASLDVIEERTAVSFGRALRASQVARGKSGAVTRFHFDDICGWRKGDALSAADYVVLAKSYNAIFVEECPIFRKIDREAAARFVRLVDAIYDGGSTALVVSAHGSPDAIFQQVVEWPADDDDGGRGRDDDDPPPTQEERTSYRRAASRLVELGRGSKVL